MKFLEYRRMTQTGKAELYNEVIFDFIHSVLPSAGLRPRRVIEKENFRFDSYDNQLQFSWEAGWGTDVSVIITLNNESDAVMLDNANIGTVKYGYLSTEINWSSTRRDIVGASAAIALYQQALQFITLVQQRYPEKYIIDDSGVRKND